MGWRDFLFGFWDGGVLGLAPLKTCSCAAASGVVVSSEEAALSFGLSWVTIPGIPQEPPKAP